MPKIKKPKLLVDFSTTLENLMINILFPALESDLESKPKRSNKDQPW